MYTLGTNHSSPNYNIPFSLFSTDRRTVSAVRSASSPSTSHFNFPSIFNAALGKYKRKSKQDLAKYLLLLRPPSQYCDFPIAALVVLRGQATEFDQSQNSDDRLTKWVTRLPSPLESSHMRYKSA